MCAKYWLNYISGCRSNTMCWYTQSIDLIFNNIKSNQSDEFSMTIPLIHYIIISKLRYGVFRIKNTHGNFLAVQNRNNLCYFLNESSRISADWGDTSHGGLQVVMSLTMFLKGSLLLLSHFSEGICKTKPRHL